MKNSKAVIVLSVLIVVLAVVQSGVGLFYQDGGSPYAFTNLRGQTIQMSGQGIYRDDPSFNAPIQRGTDAITLGLYVPLLVVAIFLYRSGSLRGRLLLSGILASFLYNAASLAFGVTYNALFLAYVALFAASLFAFLLAATSIDLPDLAARVSSGAPGRGLAPTPPGRGLAPTPPGRGLAILLFVAGLGLTFAWLPDILAGLPQGWNARLASYTTMVTDVLDLGIILPSAVLAGVLLLRRAPLGYLLAAILTIMLILIGVVVTAQTVAQLLAGINLGVGEFIAKGGSFMLLSLIGIWLMVRFFRTIKEADGDQLSV